MTTVSDGHAQSTRSRTRSGCLNCRSRRKKCNGARPQCSHCHGRGEECRYGVRALFHPSRELRLSNKDSAALLALEEERGGTQQSATRFVHNTAQIVGDYERPLNARPRPTKARRESHSEGSRSTSSAQSEVLRVGNTILNVGITQSGVLTGHAPSPQVAATATMPLRDRTPNALSPQFSVNEINHDNTPSSNGLNSTCSPDPSSTSIAPIYFDVELPVPQSEQAHLIRAYLQESGTWCEVTDSDRNFTVSYVHKLMANEPFAAAAMALASRQLDGVRRNPHSNTLGLYQHAVHSLLHYEPSQCGEATLVCCVLLSIYEMMTSNTIEWRRHLKGCVFNLTSKNWNGSSPGLVGAAFWAFARIDVWAAYLLKERTLIRPECWMNEDSALLTAATRTPGDSSNLATFLFAKIVNLLQEGLHRPEHSSISDDYNTLWNDLQVWRTHRPQQSLPILRMESNRGYPFPTVLYTGESSIYGNTFYHTGCILLLRTGRVYHTNADHETETHDPLWHAKELCGISTTNMSHPTWVHQIYPLSIAGQVFASTAPVASVVDAENEEQYAVEKIALLKHLAKIERETGWPTSGIATDLRKGWGFE